MRASKWTSEAVAMLGQRPDREIASLIGLRTETVRERRTRMRIPVFGQTPVPVPEEIASFPSLEEMTRRHILAALELTKGNQSAAARMLAIDRWTLTRAMERLGLKPMRPSRRREPTVETHAEELMEQER